MSQSITDRQIHEAAAKAGIPAWVLFGVVGKETSGRNQGATSPAGAHGVAQLMPGTARGLEQRYGIDTSTPYGNLLGGAYYLAEQHKSFGRWDYALAAYNAGPNAVREHHGIPPYAETENYVRAIMHGDHSGTTTAPSGSTFDVTPSGGMAAPKMPGPDPLVASSASGLQDLIAGTYSPEHSLSALRAMEQASPASTTQQGFVMPKVEGVKTKRDQQAEQLVQHFIGVQYQYGGESPKGFDCSGLLQYVWGKVGVEIPRTTYQQWGAGQKVSRGSLRVGDAVFFRGSDPDAQGRPGHVGFYIGGGKFIEAPHTGAVVRVAKLAGRSDYMGARRFG